MKKIVHIITRLDRGGSAINTLENCIGTCDRFQVLLLHGLARESAMTEAEQRTLSHRCDQGRARGLRLLAIPSLVRQIAPWQDLTALVTLVRILRHEKPDIVHTHTSKAGIVGRLAAWIARVPVVIHTPHGHVFHGHFPKTVAAFYLWLERLFARGTDYLVALTNGERDDYLALGVGTAARIPLIHSGVDLAPFQDPAVAIDRGEVLQVTPSQPVIGTVGWLLPIKAPLVLLAAMEIVWRHYPDTVLVYVGKGELEAEIRRRAAATGNGHRVRLLGWREDVAAIMKAMDIFVLPSRNEGMGRVLVEAMAAGCSVVASRTGGIPDLISHRENGLLVPPGDSHRLADALLEYLEQPQLAAQMREQGKKRCREYSLEAMLRKLNTLYRQALHSQADATSRFKP